MVTCKSCGSLKVENRELGLCASCAAALRKAERRKSVVKTPIKKVSDKKRNEIDQYVPMKDAFLLRKWCAVHGKPCVPVDVHHQKGKVGYADDIAREKGIPLLIDIRFWTPVCRAAHNELTEHSAKAIQDGHSVLRTQKL